MFPVLQKFISILTPTPPTPKKFQLIISYHCPDNNIMVRENQAKVTQNRNPHFTEHYSCSKELQHCTSSVERHHHWYRSEFLKPELTLAMPASVSLLQCVLKETMNSGQIQEVYSIARETIKPGVVRYLT